MAVVAVVAVKVMVVVVKLAHLEVPGQYIYGGEKGAPFNCRPSSERKKTK